MLRAILRGFSHPPLQKAQVPHPAAWAFSVFRQKRSAHLRTDHDKFGPRLDQLKVVAIGLAAKRCSVARGLAIPESAIKRASQVTN
jgi:hypothetical protein